MGVPERLKEALGGGAEKRSIRWVHQQLLKRGDLDATYSTVHRYFSGETAAPVLFLENAGDLLGVSPAWLATGEGSKIPDTEDWVQTLFRSVEGECPVLANRPATMANQWLKGISIRLSLAQIEGRAEAAGAGKETQSKAIGRILQVPFTEMGIDPEKLPPWALDTYTTNMCLAISALLTPPEGG